MKDFYRSQNDKKISGVCSGIADFFELDTTVVRVVALLVCFCAPFMIVVYIMLACFLPEKPTNGTAANNSKNNANNSHTYDYSKYKDLYDDTNKARFYNYNEGLNNAERKRKRAKLFRYGCYCTIIGALILLVANFIFEAAISFTNFIRYALLSVGLLILLNAFSENLTPSTKKTRIAIACAIIIMDILSIFNIVELGMVSAASIGFAIDYTWPLLLAGAGITILFRNRSFIKFMWIAIIAVIIIYAL